MSTVPASRPGRHEPTPNGFEPRLPAPDTAVVPGLAVFSDDAWDLSALCPRPTTRWLRLNFEYCPASLRPDIKHFFYLLLHVDTPLERLDRAASARKRLAPSTIKSVFEDLKPFLTWLGGRNTMHLAELTERDLREYAEQVMTAPIGQNPKSRRLFAVTRLWLMAPYLRGEARLDQPFWERDGIEQVVGKSEWTAENKSVPIHPATMSALLVWCLRLVEEAPRLLPDLRVPTVTGTGTRPDGPDAAAPAWTGPVLPGQVDRQRRVLVTACLITVAYLTGMRADEVLGLRRDCCTPLPEATGASSGYEIRGRTYKSAVADGRSIPAGVERDIPWTAIKPVAEAISAMEQVHEADLLFSDSLFKARLAGPQLDPGAPPSNRIRESVEQLIAWCNQRAVELGRPEDLIPADPEGGISLRRLRRTLAWFIYRRPRGRVALGIQYGHLHAATTDGYGGRVSAGLRDLFPMEEAFAISDTLHRAAQQIEDGQAVSGPAAGRYRTAVEQYRHRYQGVNLTAKQAAALLANPDLRVYDAAGQSLACCFDPRSALCRKETRTTKTAVTPDLTACDDRCANIARTDQHIATLEADLAALRLEHDAPLTPLPLQARIHAQIERIQAIIGSHRDHPGRRPS